MDDQYKQENLVISRTKFQVCTDQETVSGAISLWAWEKVELF